MLGDLGKLIVAMGFKKLPKVQKIARSGHTVGNVGMTQKSCKGAIPRQDRVFFCLNQGYRNSV